jgi:hypothetical protein
LIYLLIIWNCYLSKNYLELLLAEKPLEGFHIVVDAGNGAGGFFAVSFHCNLIFTFEWMETLFFFFFFLISDGDRYI